MLYSLKQARHEKNILPKILRLKQPIPKAFAEAPVLSPGLDIFWEAFVDLCTCRGGMGDGPIPWTAAMAWADRMELDEETTDDLWALLTRMDEVWMEHQASEREKDRGKPQGIRATHSKGISKA